MLAHVWYKEMLTISQFLVLNNNTFDPDVFLNSPQLFNDTIHVNTKGAAIFSKMVAHDIKEMISEKWHQTNLPAKDKTLFFRNIDDKKLPFSK